jgi:riboflavin synthase
MFSGIVESIGIVEKTIQHEGNLEIWVKASFVQELKIDQSIAHNGACLTVVEIKWSTHIV